MCYDFEKLAAWWNEPNKKWFKIGKLTLTILRSLIFVAFTFALVVFKINIEPKLSFPFLCLYLSLIYNWRFLISLLLVVLILLLKIYGCACGTSSDTCFIKLKKNLYKSFKAIYWSELDWPCFLRLKYYIYILNVAHYLIYLTSVVVIGLIQILTPSIYNPAVIIYFFNSGLFFAHVLIEIYRLVQAQRVQSTIRDIFAADVKFDPKALTMISEDQLGSLVCANYTTCMIADSQHRAFSHPKEIFKIKFTSCDYKQKGANIVIGFHQTTIESAKSILTTSFRPSPSGMIGKGIYFANNYDITEHKRNQSTEGGAIFCARVDLGKVFEMSDKTDNRDLSKYFNSKYLHHAGGAQYDEFVVYSDEQIVDYVIIVESKAIDSYRRRSQKNYCDCI